MTKEKTFLNSVEKLIDEFESENDNCIVGCLITLPTNKEDHSFFQWNGEKMVKEEQYSIELVEKGDNDGM